jgi:hypothetical protein
MKSLATPPARDSLHARIDEMQMSAADREHAKAQLRAAERFADGVWHAVMALRAGAAFIARQLKSGVAASAQH